MPTIAITGGIASGKTAFRQYLSTLWDAESFDADAVVAQLVDHSEEIRRKIEEAFGPMAYREEKLDRERMRALIFSDPESRKKLEAIIHPQIRSLWQQRAEACARTKARLLGEIPLLYETGSDVMCDFVVVVACPFDTQTQRLASIRGLGQAFARKMIASQISLKERLQRADQVIWNDGPQVLLMEQAHLTANYLIERYGQ